jgi:cell division protein FtsL
MKTRNIFLIILVFLIFSTILLVINAKNMKLSYEAGILKAKLNKIYNHNRILSADVAEKSSLQRIDQIAKNKLKMIYPVDMKYLLEGSGEANKLN